MRVLCNIIMFVLILASLVVFVVRTKTEFNLLQIVGFVIGFSLLIYFIIVNIKFLIRSKKWSREGSNLRLSYNIRVLFLFLILMYYLAKNFNLVKFDDAYLSFCLLVVMLILLVSIFWGKFTSN